MRPKLTLALAHYDRHVPLLDGTVKPAGMDLVVLDVGQTRPGRDGGTRHERMLRNAEFDICEVSLSSYLIARNRKAPFQAIPVFPRRLFSQSQMYCRAEAGITGPQDLVGKRVGLNSYQVTLSVLAKGDLQHEYGVPWKEIIWVTNKEETIPVALPAGVRVERAPAGKDIDELLLAGELQGLIAPHPPSSFLRKDPGVRRLFADPRAEEAQYFRKKGFYPIMHLVVLKNEVLEKHPEVAQVMMGLFEQAKETCLRHYDDPNWSSLAWGRHWVEEERAVLGEDPWPNGLQRNRANLERFIVYSYEQGLIDQPMPVESLFAACTLGT